MLNSLQTYYRSILATLLMLISSTVSAVNYGTMNRSGNASSQVASTSSVNNMYTLAGNGTASIKTANPFAHKAAAVASTATSNKSNNYNVAPIHTSSSKRTANTATSATTSVITYNGHSAKTAVGTASAAYASAANPISSTQNISTKVMNELTHSNRSNSLSHLMNQSDNIKESAQNGIFGASGNNGNEHPGWNNPNNPHYNDNGQNEIVTTPVGDAVLPLLLAALVYAFMMFIRRRKSEEMAA